MDKAIPTPAKLHMMSAKHLYETWHEYHGQPGHRECRECELAAWLNGFHAFGVHPQPYQGDDGGKRYRGQPVVWDGVFECRDGMLCYVGADGPSGGNEHVYRVVVYEDLIIFANVDEVWAT